jgi:hypothetical protein
MNRGTRKFAECLASMSDEEARFCLKMVQLFVHHLKQDFQYTDFEEEARLKRNLAYAKRMENNSRLIRKNIRFGGSFTRNFLLIIRLWPALFILGGTLVYYFLYANNVISSIDSLHDQITSAAKTVYHMDLIASASFEVIAKQANTRLRNKPIIDETFRLLSSLSDVDTLVSVFKDKDGTLTPAQNRYIYEGIDCADPYFPFYLSVICVDVSPGKASIVSLMNNFNMEMKTYLDDYMKSDRSLMQIPIFMQRELETVGPLVLVLSFLLRGLWSSTDEKLTAYMDDEEKRIETTVAVTTVLILLVVLLGLPRALKTISNKENQLKSILKLVPLSIILKNKILKSYLIRTSGKLGWSVIQAE